MIYAGSLKPYLIVILALLVMSLLTGCGNTVVKTEYIREQIPQEYLVLVAPPTITATRADYVTECEAMVKKFNRRILDLTDWSEQ